MLCSQLKVTAFTLELRMRSQTTITTIVNSGDRFFLAIVLRVLLLLHLLCTTTVELKKVSSATKHVRPLSPA